jgi:hypothetical protein
VESSLVGVSDAEGTFAIPSVAPGRYEYHAWRPGAETMTGSLTISAGQAVEVGWP